MSVYVDPITVEDWLANREIFGHEEKKDSEVETQLETAYQIEMQRAGKGESADKTSLEIALNGAETGGVFELGDLLVVAPVGKTGTSKMGLEMEVFLASSKGEKISIPMNCIFAKECDKNGTVKLKIACRGGLKFKNGKTQFAWEGTGKRKIIIDTRGRPITFLDGGRQMELIGKLKEVLK